MNRFHLIIFALMMTVAAHAQFINNGATVTIQSGATLRVETSFENQAGTITIDNGGILEVQGNFTNAAGAGTTISPSGKVRFIGTGNSDVTLNGDAINQVEMAKTTSTGKVTLLGNASINGNLEFTGTGNNKIELGNFDLSLATSSTVSAATDHMTNGYVVTGGTGRLRKSNLGTTPFTYPVGFDATTYNPVTITENGTPDTIGVRVLQKAFVNGASGSEITANVVDATWSITDAVAGGNDLSITPSWIGTDEVSFDRSQCRVVRYNGSKYDLDLATKGAATAPAPFSRQRTGITNIGNFIVSSSSFVKVAPKVFLEGAYVASEPTDAKMRDVLRANNKLPTTQPYGTLIFTNRNPVTYNGNEQVSPTVFDITGNDAIVDWVLLEVRNSSDPSIVVGRKAALIQRDGNIVDLDGISDVRIDEIPSGNYLFAVRHRVHLATRTSSPLSFSETSAPIDFTNNSNSVSNSQKIIPGTSVYGLKVGDSNRDGSNSVLDINPIGSAWNTSLANFNYFNHFSDLNLDGSISINDIFSLGANFNIFEINLNNL